MQEGYNEAKIEDIVRCYWNSWSVWLGQKHQQSIESHLHIAVNFLLSYNILLQGESRHKAELPDFFSISLPNEGSTLCYAMILIMDNRKMNQLRRIEYGVVIRHHNPLLCTMSHIAFYFFY